MADDKYSSLRALDAMQVRSLEGKKEYVASLEERGDEQALSLLVECLCDESAYLRDLAEEALGRLGDRAVEVLTPHLTSGLWFTRASVARVLGGLGAREAIPDLVMMTDDGNRAVAEAARAALVRVAAAGHSVSVARALFHASSELRQQVLAGAEQEGGTLGTQLARALSDRELMTASEEEVLREDSSALGAHDRVEWEVLTGRAGSASGKEREERPETKEAS